MEVCGADDDTHDTVVKRWRRVIGREQEHYTMADIGDTFHKEQSIGQVIVVDSYYHSQDSTWSLTGRLAVKHFILCIHLPCDVT